MPKTIPFWTQQFSILLNKNYIFELWPQSSMCYEQKMNSISRLIIIICILGYITTMNIKFILVGIVTLAAIVYVYSNKLGIKEGLEEKKPPDNSSKETGDKTQPTPSATAKTKDNKTESTPASNEKDEKTTVNPVTLETIVKSNFKLGTVKNPFSNVLLTEIMDDTNRNPAPPSFNPDIYEDITDNTKKMVQALNPGIKNVNRQMFGSLIDQFDLEKSNRQFVSMANTRIANDQGAFANYLYGEMPSCKNNDSIACVQDNFRYTMY